MKTIFILVTDGLRALVVNDSSVGQTSLPSQRQWPNSLRPSKNHWPLNLIRHVTYHVPFDWPDYKKQKKAFGMPEDSAWFLIELNAQQLDHIQKETKKVCAWFFRYASAKVPWTLKLLDFTSLDFSKSSCEAMSAHCLRSYLEKNTETKTLDTL
jgi:hypothetical protein